MYNLRGIGAGSLRVVRFPVHAGADPRPRLSAPARTPHLPPSPRYAGQSSVGFAEIAIGDDPPLQSETIAVPTDLTTAIGSDSADHSLALVLTRQRQSATDTTRLDEENAIVRTVSVPTDREFRVLQDIRGGAGERFDPGVVAKLERPDVLRAWTRIAERGHRHEAGREEEGERVMG